MAGTRLRQNVVVRDISQAWQVLAEFRTRKAYWANVGSDGKPREQTGGRIPGRMLLCEALECFLVPALDPLLHDAFERTLRMESGTSTFLRTLKDDTNELIESTFEVQGERIQTRFYTDPYTQLGEITKAGGESPQNVDCAAFVIAVLLHIWHLFGADSRLDSELVGEFRAAVDVDKLPGYIDASIDYLISCHEPGQGWRWTDHPKVPSTVYFTWTACETFGEIDDLILSAELRTDLDETADPLDPCHWDQVKIASSPFRFKRDALYGAVRSSRTWALNRLAEMSAGKMITEPLLMNKSGQDDPRYPCFPSDEYEKRKQDPAKAEKHVLWANNLMLLDVLALTYGDRDPEHSFTQENMERSLMSLVDVYRQPATRAILDNYEYLFYLHPGEGEVLDVNKLRLNRGHSLYGDKSFAPLLMRVLLLFLQYGIGNSIILEEEVAAIYRYLLEGRNRAPDYQYVWDQEGLSLFATERALEALRDYVMFLAVERTADQPILQSERTQVDAVLDDFVRLLRKALRSAVPATTETEEMSKLLKRVGALEAALKNLDQEGMSTAGSLKLNDRCTKLETEVETINKRLGKHSKRITKLEDNGVPADAD